MTSIGIRAQLHNYLDVADDKKVKAIYALVEEDVRKKGADHWSDPEFVAEMNHRVAELESGVDKGRSWEEVQNKVRQKIRSK